MSRPKRSSSPGFTSQLLPDVIARGYPYSTRALLFFLSESGPSRQAYDNYYPTVSAWCGPRETAHSLAPALLPITR